MRPVLLAFILALVLGLTLAYAQVQYKAAQGYQPGTVIIAATVPDANRVCLEPPGGGLLDCTKTVGELRKWVRGRQAK
jgi:hypothetical protein